MAKEVKGQNPNRPNEMEQLRAKADELQKMVEEKEEELATRERKISQLEQAIADRDSQIAGIKQSAAEADEQQSRLSRRLAEAVAGYKALVTSSNPRVPEELICGDTIAAINNSLSQAKELVARVKQGLEAEIELARVPTGAPVRRPPDLSALSPREKIQQALGGFSS